ncbi:MAG: TonB-dependent receptor [Ignavibacteria bacterium]|nr:TonB-dependent receptor [Ignavibacteria bacterium]
MKKIIFINIILLFLTVYAYSQTIKGTVYDNNNQKLPGVTIKWIYVPEGTLTDNNGNFELSSLNINDKRIVVFYLGYENDTLNISNKSFVEIKLTKPVSTDVINVEEQRKSSYIQNIDTKTEVITQMELKKDACCDLSGCFGKNASVDVAVTDILTNTKELKVLGLDGEYTQILVDNLPLVTGLNTKYSVTSIPGTLIDKITISKGSNSVIQGYESVSGIMNVLLKDYHSSERLMINGFMNSMMEKQVNLNTGHKFGEWHSLLSFQTVQKSNRIDENSDGFLDFPLITRYMFYNKWNFGEDEDDKTNVTIGAKYLNEERIGGQKNFYEDVNLGSSDIYGQTVNLDNAEIYSRISHQMDSERQIKFFISGMYFDQNSYYGTTVYNGKQQNFYANLLYEFPVFDKNYLRLGLSYKFDKIEEDIGFLSVSEKTYDGNYLKKESIPGIYAESSVDLVHEKLSIIAGLRLDNHNEYGAVFTPRGLLRYQITDLTVLRASFGTGFRTVNIFNEYSNHLASSKDIILPKELDAERMFNFGFDLLQYFSYGSFAGNINLDFYRTVFNSKLIPDYDSDAFKIYLNNVKNNSASNVFQIEFNINYLKNVDFKLAYKYIDLYYFENGQRKEQPFNAKHRIVGGLSLNSDNNEWIFNTTLQWFGKQQLPSTELYPDEYKRPDYSDTYILVNTQLTKNFKYIELYAGIENLFNTMQVNPIISPENPFGPYFDTSFVWGPTRGREFYLGFRFKIN